VLGHSDVAPARKDDPGEFFPWQDLAIAGIGLWPEKAEGYCPASQLAKYGYDPDAPAEKVILAFQRHFRPAHLTRQWDDGCGAILAAALAAAH
jgi:N-acetylmuramoyl-L-alanine amidase